METFFQVGYAIDIWKQNKLEVCKVISIFTLGQVMIYSNSYVFNSYIVLL